MRGYTKSVLIPLRCGLVGAILNAPTERRRKRVDRRLTTNPVIGYIKWLDEHTNMTPRQIADRLGCKYDLVYQTVINGQHRLTAAVKPPEATA